MELHQTICTKGQHYSFLLSSKNFREISNLRLCNTWDSSLSQKDCHTGIFEGALNQHRKLEGYSHGALLLNASLILIFEIVLKQLSILTWKLSFVLKGLDSEFAPANAFKSVTVTSYQGDMLPAGLFQNISVGYQEHAGTTSKTADTYKPDISQ